jgi:hypothetical protein
VKVLLGILFFCLCAYGVYTWIMNPALIMDPNYLGAVGIGIGWGIFIRGILG